MSIWHRGDYIDTDDEWDDYNGACYAFQRQRKPWKRFAKYKDSNQCCMSCRGYLDRKISYKPKLRPVRVRIGIGYAEESDDYTEYDRAMNQYYFFWETRKRWKTKSRVHFLALSKQLGYEATI